MPPPGLFGIAGGMQFRYIFHFSLPPIIPRSAAPSHPPDEERVEEGAYGRK